MVVVLREAAIAKLRELIGLAGKQRDPFVFPGHSFTRLYLMSGPQRSGLLRKLDEVEQPAWWALPENADLPPGSHYSELPSINKPILEWEPIFLGCVASWPTVRDAVMAFRNWPRCFYEFGDWLPDAVRTLIHLYAAVKDRAEQCAS